MVVSRQVLIDSKFSSVVCVPVYSRYDGLRTQVTVGVNDGLKHPSSNHCDELASLPKSMLKEWLWRSTWISCCCLEGACSSSTFSGQVRRVLLTVTTVKSSFSLTLWRRWRFLVV